MKAIVDDAVGIVDGQQKVADKHLEHGVAEVEVDRRLALRARAVKVEDQFAVFLLHRTRHGPGSHAVPVVVDKVGKSACFVADAGVD